jgi:hypothetical protein
MDARRFGLILLSIAGLLATSCSEPPQPSGVPSFDVAEATVETNEASLDSLLRQPGTAWQQLDNHTKAELARMVVERIALAHAWSTQEQILSISYVWNCLDRIESEGTPELKGEQMIVLATACAERSDPSPSQ